LFASGERVQLFNPLVTLTIIRERAALGCLEKFGFMTGTIKNKTKRGIAALSSQAERVVKDIDFPPPVIPDGASIMEQFNGRFSGLRPLLPSGRNSGFAFR